MFRMSLRNIVLVLIVITLLFMILSITIAPFNNFVSNISNKIYTVYIKIYCKIRYDISANRFSFIERCRTIYAFDSQQNIIYLIKERNQDEVFVYDKDGFTVDKALKKLDLSSNDISFIGVFNGGLDDNMYYRIETLDYSIYSLDFYTGNIIYQHVPEN